MQRAWPSRLIRKISRSSSSLRDGTALRLRPLRPEDEPLLHDLAAHMSHEDLRLRFFTPVRGLTHAVAARLSQLDYDREMALLAERDGMALGVAHFFADPDRLRAEYAIAVRSDWKGRGVGYLLMTRLIDIARQRGIGELVGEVLRENEPMLQMCRELGFAIAPEPQRSRSVDALSRKRLSNRLECEAAERDQGPNESTRHNDLGREWRSALTRRLRDVAKILREHGISAVPVVDEAGCTDRHGQRRRPDRPRRGRIAKRAATGG